MAKSTKKDIPFAGLFSMVGEPSPVARGKDADITLIRRGFKWDQVEKIQKTFEIKDDMFALILGVSARTLTRAKGSRATFDPVASDRAFRMAKILKLAVNVFEDIPNAVRWLNREQPGLAGKVPMQLLDTDPGSHQVETLLHQLEYGVLP